MTFKVIVETEAKANLLRLYKYLPEQAEYAQDLDIAGRALQAIEAAMASLAKAPFLFRKAAGACNTLRRELVIPSGASGFVLKYEIASPQLVVVLAVRYQHEGDCH